MFMSLCASIQSTPPDAAGLREAAERPERDRVVAAEDERERALVEREARRAAPPGRRRP